MILYYLSSFKNHFIDSSLDVLSVQLSTILKGAFWWTLNWKQFRLISINRKSFLCLRCISGLVLLINVYKAFIIIDWIHNLNRILRHWPQSRICSRSDSHFQHSSILHFIVVRKFFSNSLSTRLFHVVFECCSEHGLTLLRF